MVAAEVAVSVVVAAVAAPALLAEAAGAALEADVEGLVAAHVEHQWIWAHLSEFLGCIGVSFPFSRLQA